MTGITNKTAVAAAYQGFHEIYQLLRAVTDNYSELTGKLDRESEKLSGSGQDALRELHES